MRKLSLWAHCHKTASRIIIVFIYLFLNVAGLFLGDLLYSLHIKLPPFFSFLAITMTLAGVILYPSRRRKRYYKDFYLRQKFADGLLIIATFLFIVYGGNSLNSSGNLFYNSAHGVSMLHNPPDNYESDISGGNTGEKRVSKKASRKQFTHVLKELRKSYQKSSKTHKTIAIIIVLLSAVALTYGMLALACSIACSGSEALAIIVGVLGVGAIIFGAIKIIQRIRRGKPENREPISSPSVKR